MSAAEAERADSRCVSMCLGIARHNIHQIIVSSITARGLSKGHSSTRQKDSRQRPTLLRRLGLRLLVKQRRHPRLLLVLELLHLRL